MKKFIQKIKNLWDKITGRDKLLKEIDDLKAEVHCYRNSRGFVHSKNLMKHSFNFAISKYEYGNLEERSMLDDYLNSQIGHNIAEFLSNNRIYQVYDGTRTSPKYFPDDEVKIYHFEFWFEQLEEKATEEDYARTQYHDGRGGFHLDCIETPGGLY